MKGVMSMKYVKIVISDGTALERELVKEHIYNNVPCGPVRNLADGSVEMNVRAYNYEEDLDEVIQHITYISELYSSSLKLLVDDPTEAYS